MAKRKRLTPADLTPSTPPAAELETKSRPIHGSGGLTRAPIAQVAGDTAARAALEDLASEVTKARVTGRMVQSLPLSEVHADHLLRDRIISDTDEMASLKNSIKARGQQTPIEVVELDGGGYGLISGFRRLTALKELFEDTKNVDFSVIHSLIKPKDSVSDSYVAMVEENEIRADLSLYERARIAVEASKLGVYPTAQHAVQTLFAHASAAKRSKIKSFIPIHEVLGKVLLFPSAIPERLGLALSAALDATGDFGRKLRDNLRNNPSKTAAQERQLLERALQPGKATKKTQTRTQESDTAPKPAMLKNDAEVAPGITVTEQDGNLVLSGKNITAILRADLVAWLRQRV
jgi:ParB family chromosome partitioning protein